MKYYCKKCGELLVNTYIDDNGYNTIYAVNTINCGDNFRINGISGNMINGEFDITCKKCNTNNKFK